MASRTAYSTWTTRKPTLFDGYYLRNRSTLDIGVLGYIGIVQHKEHSPEVLSIPPGTPCIRRAQGEFSLHEGWLRTRIILQYSTATCGYWATASLFTPLTNLFVLIKNRIFSSFPFCTHSV